MSEDDVVYIFFFSSRRRHTRCSRDWSSDVCYSDLYGLLCRTLDFGRRRSITFHAVRLVGNSKLCQRRAAPIREVGSLGRVDLSKSGATITPVAATRKLSRTGFEEMAARGTTFPPTGLGVGEFTCQLSAACRSCSRVSCLYFCLIRSYKHLLGVAQHQTNTTN